MLFARTIFLAISIASASLAAEAPPVLPDPIGLGQRLVLIEHLRSQFKLEPPADAPYERLVELYWQEMHKRNPATAVTPLDDAIDDENMARDRVNRLRDTLKHECNVEAPADATEEQLAAMLRERRERRQQQANADRQARSGHGEGSAKTDQADGSDAKTSKESDAEKPRSNAANDAAKDAPAGAPKQ